MDVLTPILRDIGLLAKPALFNIYFALASIPIGFVLAIFLALFCGPMANAWADRWPVRQYNLRKDTHDPKKSLGKRQLKLHRLLEGRNKKPVPLKRANLKQRRGR